jgi:UPF0716 protein FxsA
MVRLAIGLIFIVLPVLELAVLVKTGQLIGFWATLALVMVTATSGALILSQQGFSATRRALEAMSEGRMPVAPVLDGVFLMLAGALLLTPGLITDVFALLLLVPPVRRAIARWSVRRMLRGADVHVYRSDPESQPPPAPGGKGPIIEGEFERLGEKPTAPRKGNGTLRP